MSANRHDRSTDIQRRIDFAAGLRLLSRRMRHADLAKYLGIERNLLRNWIYRDTPGSWAVAMLSAKLQRKLKQTKKRK